MDNTSEFLAALTRGEEFARSKRCKQTYEASWWRLVQGTHIRAANTDVKLCIPDPELAHAAVVLARSVGLTKT